MEINRRAVSSYDRFLFNHNVHLSKERRAKLKGHPMKKFFAILLTIAVTGLYGQQKDPDKFLEAVKQKFNKVNDYSADVTVKFDISFLKMADSKVKIYFKQPDKVKLDSKGFAMLPKQSVNFSPAQLFKGDYTALFVKSEVFDGKKTDVIKIIPNSDSTDIILSTLWIDVADLLIRKVEINGKRSGTTTIQLDYENTKYSLPSKVIFAFNLGNMEIPEQLQGNQQPQQQENTERKGRRSQKISGSVILTYSNYQINKGIPDSIFDDDKKGK